MSEKQPINIKQLEQMADDNIAFAMNKLGDYYSDYDAERKCIRDEKKALALYKKAVDLGNTQAMYNLGVHYEYSEPADMEKAMECYVKAAESYNLDAMFKLATHHHWVQDGDSEQAYTWFQTAAAFGHPEAMDYLVDYAEDDLEVAQSWAIRSFCTYRSKSEKGDVDATKRLAEKLKHGLNIEKDVPKAMEYYKIAYYQGFKEAPMYIAELYHIGEMGEGAYEQAAYWYEKAANDGNVKALYNLGEMHYLGDGIPVDMEKAQSWFKQAVTAYEKLVDEDTEYLFRLGYMYANGYGVKQDDERALFYFSTGAKQEDPDCMHWLATFHEEGRGGLPVNEKLAAELHEQADELY